MRTNTASAAQGVKAVQIGHDGTVSEAWAKVPALKGRRLPPS